MNKYAYIILILIAAVAFAWVVAWTMVMERELKRIQGTRSFGVPESQMTCEMSKYYVGTIYKKDGLTVYYQRKWRF
jgi:hypothetical protein